MANSETGITINFRGNTAEFASDVDGINKALKLLSKDIKALNKELKLDPTNVETLNNKFNELKQKQELLTKQAKNYREAIENMGTITNNEDLNKLANFQGKLADVEVQLRKVKEEMNLVNAQSIKDFSYNLDKACKVLDNVGNALDRVGKALLPLSTASGLALGTGIKYNLELEKTQVALERILGTQEEANKVMQEFISFSDKTPFSPKEITRWAQMMMAGGASVEEARKTIEALGNAVSATGGGTDEMNRMIQNLLQFRGASPEQRDLKQFQYAYIDIYGALSDYMGENARLLKSSEISYEDVIGALIKASEEGGRYANGMASASETTAVKMEKLRYQLQQLAGDLAESLMPTVQAMVDKLKELIDRFKALDPQTKQMITKALLLTTALAPTILLLSKLILGFSGLGKAFTAIIKNKDILMFLANFKTKFMDLSKLVSTKLAGSKLLSFIPKLISLTGGLLPVIGLVIGALVLMYNKSEAFRNAVNNLAKAIMDILKPVFDNIVGIINNIVVPAFKWLWDIVSEVANVLGNVLAPFIDLVTLAIEILVSIVTTCIDTFKLLWEMFEQSELCQTLAEAFDKVGEAVSWVVDKVKALFDWFGSLIDRAREFLGLNEQISTHQYNGVTHGGGGGHAWSGGFDKHNSGGFAVNTTINVNNNGSQITRSEVNRWADVMVDRVNERLGRLV